MNKLFNKKIIKSSKTFGQLLSSARKRREISLQKAEIDTKIRMKFIIALEKDDFKNMPPDVYNIGFIKRYCQYLGLNSIKILDKYHNEKLVFEKLNKKLAFTKEDTLINPGNPNKYRSNLKYVLTPQIFVTTLIIICVVGILGYVWFQVKSFAAAPELAVDNASDQIMVSTDTIKISGKTDASATLLINDQGVAIDELGNFSQDVKLIDGINTIEIKALNKADKSTIKNIKVLAVLSSEGQ